MIRRIGWGVGLAWVLAVRLSLADGPAPHSVTYSLKQPGRVSLAVYAGDGRLVRELLRGAQRQAGEHTVAWDGLDRYGNAVPPGEYQWRLLRNQGLRAEYRISLGSNPTSAPYHLWVGNHAGPTSVHVASDGTMYVSAVSAENAPTLLKQSRDGRQRFWERYRPEITEGRWQGGVSLTTDGRGRLYLLQQNGLIQVIECESGNLLTEVVGSRANAGAVANRAARKWDPFPGETGHEGASIAGAPDAIVLSASQQNAVRWLSLEDGRTEHRVEVEAPRGIAVAPDGAVYVVARDRILAVSRDGEPKPVVTGLVNPTRLAYDRANGHLLVVVGAPHPNHVQRYDLKGGLVATYGRKGGRGFGPYVAEDFYNIVDLASDHQGGFVVVESGHETFRRTAHFDGDGKLLNEWHGGQRWGSFVTFDPERPTRVMFNGGAEVKALAEADFENRVYRVTHLLRAPDTGGLMPSLTGHGALWRIERRGGKAFLVNAGGHVASSAPAVYRADWDRGVAVPVARAGNIPANAFDGRANKLTGNAPAFWLAALKHHGVEIGRANVGQHMGYSWSDDNGNGEMDAEEILVGPSFGFSSLFIDAEWNLLAAGAPGGAQAPFLHVVPNRNPAGAPPRWVWSDAAPLPHRAPAEWVGFGRGQSATAVFRASDGSIFVFAKGHAHPADDRQGESWPANTSGAARLMKWNAAGELAWNVGRHASAKDSLPGQFHDPMRVLGEVQGNIVVQDRVIRVAQVFTPDGLYAGDFFDDHAADGLPAEIYTAAPTVNQPGLLLHDNIGSVMQVTPDGHVLWNPSGRTGAPVYRIHGWEAWERQRGTLRIERAAAAAARLGEGLSGRYFASRAFAGAPVTQRVDTELWFGNRSLAFTRDLSGRPWHAPAVKADPPFVTGAFSARWEGEIEAPFGEAFRFFIESEYGSHVKLWLDGREIIAAQEMPLHESGRRLPGYEGRTMRAVSEPVPLRAGRRYAIRLDYVSGGEPAQLHLTWESFSQERQHVPTAMLYPENSARAD